MEKQKETQKLIKAVLMPHKNGLLLKELEKEYFGFENRPIPYRAFGFGNLISYLESISDVVRVQKLANGDHLVQAVADAKDAHLARLVSGQVTKTKSAADRKTEKAISEQKRLVRQKLRTIPIDLQEDIIGLVVENPRGIDIRDFDEKFHQKYNRRIQPIQFGYNSTLDLITSLTNTIVNLRQPRQGVTLIYPREEILASHAPKQQNRGDKKFDRPPRFTGNSAALPARPDTYGSEDVRVSDGTSFETGATTKLATKTNLPIPKSVESNLKNLMRLCPNGLPAMKLVRLYEDQFHTAFDYRDFNCVSLMEVCHRLPEIFYVHQDQGKPAMLYPPQSGFPSKAQSGKSLSKSSGDLGPRSCGTGESVPTITIPDDVVTTIKRIFVKNPINMTSTQVEEKYIEETGMPLKVKSYGAKDVEDFLSSPCFSFLKVSRELDPLRRDGVQLDVRVKPNALPYIKAELLVTNSEFFTGSEFGIPTQTLPDGLQKTDWFDLYVEEIQGIDNFYFLLKGPTTFEKLKELMDDLEDLYGDENLSNAFRMPQASMLVSSYCACRYTDGMWYRGFITKIVNSNACVIYYIDYGTLSKVGLNNIRFLHTKFASLPAQAIPARLAGLRPPNGEKKFSLEGGKELLNISGRMRDELSAQLRGLSTNLQSKKASLWVANRSANFEVNSELIRLGYAEADPEAAMNDDYKFDSTKDVSYNSSAFPSASMPIRKPLVAAMTSPEPKLPTSAPPVFIPNLRSQSSGFCSQTKPLELVYGGSGIQSMPFQEQSAYNPHFSLPPPINAISQQQQMHFNQMQSAYPAHQQHSLVNPPPAMGVCLSQAPSSEVSGGAESVRSSSKFSTVENQCSVDGKKSFNFQDAVKSAKEFVPRQSKLVDTTLSQRSSQKSTTSSLAIRYDPNKPLFKKVQLTSAGEVIHIANIGDKPWVVSAEISRLIPRWNGDILAKMLKLFKESKPTLVYQREQSLRLFEQCINEDLPGVFVGEDIVDSLTFYRLVDVPDILRKYNTSLTDKLLSSVIDEIERFDPNDLHWSGDQQI